MPSTRSVLVADASHDTRDVIARALADDAWTVERAVSLGEDDGIEVLSDRPEWISVRASCRPLTADRSLKWRPR